MSYGTGYGTGALSAGEGTSRIAGGFVVPVLVASLVTWLVYRYEAPVGLTALVVGAGLLFLLARPAVATLTVVFLLYTNIPAVLHIVHGVPRAVAGSVVLLLAIPLVDHLVLRRARLRVDAVIALMLGFLVVMLLSSLAAKDKAIALGRVLEYAAEGVLLYWLLLNVVRDLPTLRRVVWAALAAGALLTSLNIYQSATGDYTRDFGGLAARQTQHLEANQERVLEGGVRASKLFLADRAAGPQMDSNYLSQIMLVLLPLAWLRARNGRTPRGRLFAIAVGGVILVGGVFLTYSRGALLTLVVVVLIAAYIRWLPRRLVLAAALCAVPLLPAIAPKAYKRMTSLRSVTALGDRSADVSFRGRATEMLAAAHVAMDYPVLGVGPGQYKPFYSVQYQQLPGIKFRDIQHVRRAHNLYLELAAETGVVGVALFLAIPVLLLRALWDAHRRFAAWDPELADTAVALLLSILAFMIAGMFLTLAYQRYYWLLLALAGTSLQIMRTAGRTRGGPA